MQTSLYQWLEDVLRRVRNGHSKEYRLNSLLHRVPFVDFHDERKLSIPDDEDRRGKRKARLAMILCCVEHAVSAGIDDEANVKQ